MEEALRPIVDFRRYKITDNAAVREFYSLLRAAIKGAKGIGRLGLLINDQTVPKIMSKIRCLTPTGRSGPPRGLTGCSRT